MTQRVGGHMPSLCIRRRKGIVGEEGEKGRGISPFPTVILRLPRMHTYIYIHKTLLMCLGMSSRWS